MRILTPRPVDVSIFDEFLEEQAFVCGSIHDTICQPKQYHVVIEHELCDLVPAEHTAIVAQVFHHELKEDQNHGDPKESEEAEEWAILGGSMSSIEGSDWKAKCELYKCFLRGDCMYLYSAYIVW